MIYFCFRYCGVNKPSWMELRNFIYFFNQQLVDSEASAFTSSAMNQDLRGFKAFVIKFLLEMAKVSRHFFLCLIVMFHFVSLCFI